MKLTAEKRRLLPVVWCLMALAILTVNYFAGAAIGFSTLMIFPVGLAARYNGRFWGIAMAIVGPVTRLVFFFYWKEPLPWKDSLINAVLGMSVFIFIALLIDRVTRQEREIRVLQGMLPICAFCKKIRTPDQNWQQMETYITAHSEATFTHGFCPECAKQHYGEGSREDGQQYG